MQRLKVGIKKSTIRIDYLLNVQGKRDPLVHINTGNQKLAAYGWDIQYDSSILRFRQVMPGPDGFLSAHAMDFPLQGFDTSGKGPGVNLNVVILEFETIREGTTAITVVIISSEDVKQEIIGEPRSINSKITVANPSIHYGDVDANGIVNIVDALMVAQYTVGLLKELAEPRAADVTADGIVNIVDALSIAQSTVSWEYFMPINSGRDEKNWELVPQYPDSIPPMELNPLLGNIRVKLQDVVGNPVPEVSVSFSGENIQIENDKKTVLTGSDGIATTRVIVTLNKFLDILTILKASSRQDGSFLRSDYNISVHITSPGIPKPINLPGFTEPGF